MKGTHYKLFYTSSTLLLQRMRKLFCQLHVGSRPTADQPRPFGTNFYALYVIIFYSYRNNNNIDFLFLFWNLDISWNSYKFIGEALKRKTISTINDIVGEKKRVIYLFLNKNFGKKAKNKIFTIKISTRIHINHKN